MIISIRPWAKGLMLAIAAWLMMSCNGDRKNAAATAKTFLQAYYVDLDFNKALQLSSEVTKVAVQEQADMIALNPYAKEETPDLVLVGIDTDKSNAETATFVYTCNRAERTLPLRKVNGKWLVDLQGGSVEAGGNTNDFLQLSSGCESGFASATSGEIKYKKRRQESKQYKQ